MTRYTIQVRGRLQISAETAEEALEQAQQTDLSEPEIELNVIDEQPMDPQGRDTTED